MTWMQPIFFIVLSSANLPLSLVDEYAQQTIAQRISTISGVAQVDVQGSQKYAVRVKADLDQLTARGLTIADVQTALAAANSNQPVGTPPCRPTAQSRLKARPSHVHRPPAE